MNFALILFLLLVATAVLWVADRFVFRKRRAPGAKEPLWVEYGASFFPVILVVFFLRSFIVEPFKIPSGSMIPTLLVGDFIVVNKFTYGIRLPVINKKIIDVNSPQRGDVMVFRWPVDPSLDYIKRVVGLPGDKVAYQNKRLTINGQPQPVTRIEDYKDKDRMIVTPRFRETLGTVQHDILLEDEAPTYVAQTMQFPFRDDCHYNSEGFICTVPPGNYLVMGDNRDNSQDSRVWGFVPDENIVGKAFFIWFNFSDLQRIGSFR
ncbi:MAG: signal peptidase I [Rhodocyclaceae bacterium]|nr:signal peptidase I [Rhodocyclaceae bacterium]